MVTHEVPQDFLKDRIKYQRGYETVLLDQLTQTRASIKSLQEQCKHVPHFELSGFTEDFYTCGNCGVSMKRTRGSCGELQVVQEGSK